ncbi:hypothetical protein [Scytonema sp. NUACC26]
MWRYKIRAIILTGVVCVFVVWTTPVRSLPAIAAVEKVQEKVG